MIPEGARREPLLQGVDRVEADFASCDAAGTLHDADPAARYTHILLTGVAEARDRAGLTALLSALGETAASDAVAALDGFLVEGMALPPVKRWSRDNATTTRQGPLCHHHLDEIELAALESGWLVGEVALDPRRAQPGPPGQGRRPQSGMAHPQRASRGPPGGARRRSPPCSEQIGRLEAGRGRGS